MKNLAYAGLHMLVPYHSLDFEIENLFDQNKNVFAFGS